MMRIRDPKNLACAGLFVGLAVVLAASALSLPIGTAGRMGPGYFPLVLALILGFLGLLLAITSLRVEGEAVSSFEWRGFLLVTLAIIAFGVTVNRFGFIPALAVSTGISILASDRFRLTTALSLIAGIVIFCWAVFSWGLGLPTRLFIW